MQLYVISKRYEGGNYLSFLFYQSYSFFKTIYFISFFNSGGINDTLDSSWTALQIEIRKISIVIACWAKIFEMIQICTIALIIIL